MTIKPIYSKFKINMGENLLGLSEDKIEKVRIAEQLIEDAFNTIEIYEWFADFSYSYTTRKWFKKKCYNRNTLDLKWRGKPMWRRRRARALGIRLPPPSAK